MEMESPYMFEVRNLDPGKRELFTHCGVLEFIADPGTVHLPPWVRSSPLQVNARQSADYFLVVEHR